MKRIENVLCDVCGKYMIGTLTEIEENWFTFHHNEWTYPQGSFTPIMIIKNIKYKNKTK